jgi:hypothetical protein
LQATTVVSITRLSIVLPLRVDAFPELLDNRVQSNWKMRRKPLCEAIPCSGQICVRSKEFSRVDLASPVLKFRVRTMEQVRLMFLFEKTRARGFYWFTDSVILKTEAKRTRQSTGH